MVSLDKHAVINRGISRIEKNTHVFISRLSFLCSRKCTFQITTLYVVCLCLLLLYERYEMQDTQKQCPF
jgi:hypothetical protein